MEIAELQYRIERKGVAQRIVHLRVGSLDCGLALDKAALEVSKKRDVPGFRKGRAPLKRVLGAHYREVSSKAFNEIWSAALRQVLRTLDELDQPLIPPELDGDEDKWPRPAHGELLEFSVTYIVDPVRIADAMDPAKRKDADSPFALQPVLPYHGAPRMPGPAGPPEQGAVGMQPSAMPDMPGPSGE